MGDNQAQNNGQLTADDVRSIVREQFTELLNEALATMVTERLKPMLDERDVRLANERDTEIDVLEQRMKSYADQQDREWDKTHQARIKDVLEQLDEILERITKISASTTSALSSHENRTRDQLKSFENRIVAVENSATSRDRQIQAIENNIDDLIKLTTKNEAAARANATSIGFLRRDQEEAERRLEETVKRNNELHDKIDDIRDYMEAQKLRQERWSRWGRRVLDFLSSRGGKRLIAAGATILTILAGHVERVWIRFFDWLGF